MRILSGFYGIVRPFDGVVPYRLEMQAKLGGPGFSTLYEFWNRRLADQLFAESDTIVNLASKEYSKCISPYLRSHVRMVSVVFGQEIGGKVVERATLVKNGQRRDGPVHGGAADYQRRGDSGLQRV
ncbi:YaaA family protein [Paenibacillus rhizoplanae]